MTNKYFLTTLFTCLLLSNLVSQTIDIASVGASYSQQTFYNISTGETESLANESWDIAFSNLGSNDGGVFINESSTFMGTALELFQAETTDWDIDIKNTDDLTEEDRIYNPELDWEVGAFNTVKDSSSSMDYGWGEYNPSTETIEGTKIFLIKKRNGTFIKMQIESLNGDNYTFKYANLDGSNEKNITFSKAEYDQKLIFFSFNTESFIETSIEYDIIFLRYSTLLDAGNGTLVEYTVAGGLLAPGAEAAVATDIDPLSVKEEDYADDYTTIPTVIGSDWKFFDFSLGWVIDFERVYFIKANDGSKYKMQFIDFGGSSTGKITIEKEKLGPTSINNYPRVDISVFPNPVVNDIQFNINLDNNTKLHLINSSGQVIYSGALINNSFTFPEGTANGQYFGIIKSEENNYQFSVIKI